VSISVGSVTVLVIPTTKGIEGTLRSQLEPPAAKVGDEVGKTLGDKISGGVQAGIADAIPRAGEKAKAPAAKVGDQLGKSIGDSAKKPIEDAIPEGVDSGGKKALPAATEQGSRVGGAFADTFKSRLEAAFKALPKAAVDADTTPALDAVERLRLDLLQLSRQRVGVDIDAATALTRMAEIRAQLVELSRGADVDVRVDAAKALVELDAVTAEVDRLDGRNAKPDIQVNSDKAMAAIRAVAFALLGLSAIPAVATIGIAGAGLVAGGLAAGAGVGAVSLAALPGLTAVKNAYTAQTAAATAAATATANAGAASNQAAQQALQEAGAQQQLAAAQRQAGYAHQQALQQVTSAEQSLAQAQQASLAAQKAVDAARKQAAQDLQDLNNSVTDASLSQRADQIALEQATAALHATQANPAATALQRQQAQLAYDQADQQLKEQGLAYQRLQDQAATANAAGVAGSVLVTTAQQQQAQTTQALQNAQRQLADARANVARTDQQSADSIAAAQRSILSLQLQAAAAATGTGNAQATAAAQAKAAYDRLTPSEKAVFDATTGLKTAFTGWAQSVEPDVLPLFANGLNIVKSLLPDLTPLVTGAAGALGTLETRSAKALGSPVWQKFAGDIAKASGPSILGFGTALGHVATGVMGVVDAVLPYAPRLLDYLDKVTGGFSRWGQSLGGSSGFSSLVGYVEANGPKLVHTVEEIAKAAVAVVQALAPMGGTALSVDGEIAHLIGTVANFSPGLVQWGLGLAVAYKGISPLVSGAKSLIGGPTSGVTGIVQAFTSGGTAGSKFGGVLVKAKGWLSSSASAASTAISGGWSSFTSLLSTGATNAATLGTNVLGAAKKAGTAVGSGLSSAGTAIANGASAALSMATNLGKAGIAYAVTGIKAAGAGIAVAANAVATGVATAATSAWTVATGALNVVMDANPLILVGIAIAALIAAIVLAYQHSATFRDIVKDTWHVIGDVVQGTWRDVIKPVFDFLKTVITQDVPHAFDTGVSAVKNAFVKIADVTATPVNFVLQYVYDDGIAKLWNTVVGAVGLSSLKLPVIAPLKIPKLAAGGVAPLGDGPAVVNRPRAIVGEGDPRYPEYVIPTDPQYRGRAKALHAAAGTQLLAGGGVLGGIGNVASSVWKDTTGAASLLADLLTDPRGTWDNLVKGSLALTGKISGGSQWGQVVAGTPIAAAGRLGDYIIDTVSAIFGGDKHASSLGSTLGSAAISARWAPTVAIALGQLGIPATSANIGGGLIIIGGESGGNPDAVNKTDVNWQHGTPSVGLMQVIGPTFKSWAGPYAKALPQLYGVSTNPIANIYAGLDYGVHRYHSIANIPGVDAVTHGKPYVGYDSGGQLPPGVSAVYNGTGRPEPVLTAAQWEQLDALARGQGGPPSRTTQMWVYPPAATAEAVATEVQRRLEHAGIS